MRLWLQSLRIDCNAVFEIESFCGARFYRHSAAGKYKPFPSHNDGEEVDSVTFDNGRFIVGISELVSRLQHQMYRLESAQ